MTQHKAPAHVLNSVYLYMTSGCNLKCSHCWLNPTYARTTDETEGITVDDVKKIIAEGKPLGLSNMKLTGGEPFLNGSVFEIIEVISSAGLTMDIETNGVLIDDEAAAFLKNHSFTTISVSIDGSTPDYHDAFRGVKGSWDDAVAGTSRLIEAGLNVQIIMSLLEDNAGDIENVVSMAKRLGANSVKFNPVTAMGRGERLTERGKTLSVAKLIDLLPWVEQELAQRYSITTFFSMPNAFKKIHDFFNGNNAQCHIFNIIGVIATGDVSICGIGKEEPELVIGNIRKDNLADLWENSVVLNDLRRVVPRELKGVCGKCILKGLCLGACRAHAFVLTRDLTAPDRICQEAYDLGLFPETRIA